MSCCVVLCLVLSCVVVCVRVSVCDSRVQIQNASVCTFKTSPCMLATRAHMFQHVRVVPAHHGDVSNVHTGTFWTDTRCVFSAVKQVIFDIS